MGRVGTSDSPGSTAAASISASSKANLYVATRRPSSMTRNRRGRRCISLFQFSPIQTASLLMSSVDSIGSALTRCPLARRRVGRTSVGQPARSTLRSAKDRPPRFLSAATASGAVYPHILRAAVIMAALDAGVPLRDVCNSPPDTQTRERQRSMAVGARTSTAMPRTPVVEFVAFVAGA